VSVRRQALVGSLFAAVLAQACAGGGHVASPDLPVSPDGPVITGSIDVYSVRRVVRDHAGEIRRCYEARLAVDPSLQGKVTVRWIIRSDGAASDAAVDVAASTLLDGELHRCMESRIDGWRFEALAGGETAAVVYPWTFRTAPVPAGEQPPGP
jgi:hypothetical protein